MAMSIFPVKRDDRDVSESVGSAFHLFFLIRRKIVNNLCQTRRWAALILFLGLYCWQPVTQATDLNTGLIAYWPFDSGAQDASGKGHNGLVHGATLTLGKFGNAYQFKIYEEGGARYITVPYDSGLDLSNTNFTLSAWIYRVRANYHYSGAILARRSAKTTGTGKNNGWALLIHGTDDGKANENIDRLKYKPSGYQGPKLVSTKKIPKHSWHHVVLTYDRGTKKATLYKNGQSVGASTIKSPTHPEHSNKELFIGRESFHPPRDEKNCKEREKLCPHVFFGKMDDIRIYRRALSGTEVQQLYRTNPNDLKPDLVVSNLSLGNNKTEYYEGDSITINATVKNQGLVASNNTTLYYKLNNSVLANDSVKALYAGQAEPKTRKITAPQAGNWVVNICVASVVGESNPSNNCSSKQIRVVKKPELHPDLIVTSVRVNKTEIIQAEDFTIETVVKNQGNMPSGTTMVDYKLSADSTITTTDQTLRSESISGQGVGSTKPLSTSLKAPINVASYWVGMCVRPVAKETATNNNCSQGVELKVVEVPIELIVDKKALKVPEEGAGMFKVSLSAKPFTDIVVKVSKLAGSEKNAIITFKPSQLKFTSDSWNTPQPVTVTAAKDENLNNGSVTIEVIRVADKIAKKTVVVTEIDKGPPILELDPSSRHVDFGEVGVDDEKTKRLTVYNRGNAELHITNMTFPYGFAAKSNECEDKQVVIEAQGSCKVMITFLPTQAIPYSDNLVISSNAVGEPTQVKLSGEGIIYKPVLGVQPDSLKFEKVEIGTESQTQLLTLLNKGKGKLTVQKLTPPDGFLVTKDECSGQTIEPKPESRCQIGVTFKPDGANEPKDYEDSLTIEMENGDSPTKVTLTGKAVPYLAPKIGELQQGSGNDYKVLTLDGSDSQPSEFITGYKWTITPKDGGKPITATGKVAKVRLPSKGEYDVVLTTTIVDSDGESRSKSTKPQVFSLEYDGEVKLGWQLNGLPSDEAGHFHAGVCEGTTFNVQVRVDAYDVDGVSAFVDFDPSVLEVLRMTELNSKLLTLEKHDDGNGKINFVVFALGEKPDASTEFGILDIQFQVKPNTDKTETALHFNTEEPMRITGISNNGLSVLNVAPDMKILLEKGGYPTVQVAFQGHQQAPSEDWLSHITLEVDNNRSGISRLSATAESVEFQLSRMWKIGEQHTIGVFHERTLRRERTATFFSCSDFEQPISFTKELNLNSLKTEEPLPEDMFLLEGDLNCDNSFSPSVGEGPVDLSRWKEVSENPDSIYYLRMGDINLDGQVTSQDESLIVTNVMATLERQRQKLSPFGMGTKDKEACLHNDWIAEKDQLASSRSMRNPRDGKINKSPVILRIAPLIIDLKVGDNFSTDIEIQGDENQYYDGVSAYIDFDASSLRVNEMVASNQFDTVLENHFDKEGHINFVGFNSSSDNPKGTVKIVTINFTLLGKDGEKSLRFSQKKPRRVGISYAGRSIQAGTDASGIINRNDWGISAHTVSGKVLDKSGNGVAGVTIEVDGQTVVTGENGHFELVDMVPSDYTLNASKEGLNFAPKDIVIEGDNPVIEVEIREVDTNMPAPAFCKLYAVHDGGLNNSQFLAITLDDYQVSLLGPVHKGRDIEAIAIDPVNNAVYAASGDNVENGHPKGHLYLVDALTGDISSVGNTGFNEIEELAFSADGETLWAWAKGDGLITIDKVTGVGTLVIPSDVLIEGLTLSKAGGTVFYGAVNSDLWIYDKDASTLDVACINLPGETEALEGSADLLLIGVHKDQSLSIHVFDPETCQMVAGLDIPTTKDDIEGIAIPVEACVQ
jgi:hypothetical protein